VSPDYPITRAAGARWGDALVRAQRWAYDRSRTVDGQFADFLKSECLLGDPALSVRGRTPAGNVHGVADSQEKEF
jgi:hypothetical protein